MTYKVSSGTLNLCSLPVLGFIVTVCSRETLSCRSHVTRRFTRHRRHDFRSFLSETCHRDGKWTGVERWRGTLTGRRVKCVQDVAVRAVNYLWQSRHRTSDLVGTVINIHNGDWVRRGTDVRLSARFLVYSLFIELFKLLLLSSSSLLLLFTRLVG